MNTWRKLINEEMKDNDESFDDVVHMVFDGDIDDEFDDGYGGNKGCYFQLWTKNRVYFPMNYDGSEWCGSAEREPSNNALEHQGGG